MDKDRSQLINNEPSRGAGCRVGSSTTIKCPKCAPLQPRILWQSSLTGEIPRPSDMEEGLTGPQTRRETIDTCDEKASFRSRILPLAPWRRTDSWREWAKEEIATSTLVPSLAVQAFATGILDATTYADFHTFASNQTGNTILLTVAALGTIKALVLLTGVSLAAFLAGAFIFGHLGHFFGVRCRSWIMMSTVFQIALLIVSAILVSPSGPAVTRIGGRHEWLVLVLFAHMSGAQVAQARQSGSAELPTAPMTSSYVDLMSDKYLFVGFRHKKAGPRNRRMLYILAMIVGGFMGAVIHKWAGSWAVVAVTIALKVLCLVLIALAVGEE